AALSNVDANDVINFSSTAVTADATALNALNTLADTKSYANLATITEDAATIGASAVEITNALAIKAGAAVTITNAISAADLDTIAAATAGIVTASLAVTTPITDATVAALSNVDANDVINFSSTAVTADATALNALNTLADTKSYANLATITEDAATIGASAVEITNALAIKAGAAVTITNAISAADANTIANATNGTVTATVTAAAASVLASTLTNALGTDELTLTVNAEAAAAATAATDLNTLDSKTNVDVDTNLVTHISGLFNDVNTLYVTNNANFVNLGDEFVVLSDATVAAADANTIADKTSSAVTATVTAAAASVLVAALTNADQNDVLTLTVNAEASGATAATDLNTLDGKTSVDVDTTSVTSISGELSALNTLYGNTANFTALGDEAITITDSNSTPILATDLSTIGGATTNTVTVTNAIAITGTQAQVTAALVTPLTQVTAATATVTISDAAFATSGATINATDLSDIGNATAGTVTVSNAIKITGTIAQVTAALVTTASKVVAAHALVDITGAATIAELNAVDAVTDGIITATVADTAHNLATLTGTGNNYTLTVTADKPVSEDVTQATDLLKIDAATTAQVTATAVEIINGTAADIAAVITASTTDLDAVTGGVQSSITLSGTVNAKISDTNVSATDLKTIDTVVGGTVNASSVTTLTGSAADISAVLTAVGLGTITLTPSAISVVIDGSSSSAIDAALLKTINEAGFTLVDARAISHIHGLAADIDTLYPATPLAATIVLANNVKVLIDDTTITAALLNDIDLHTNAVIDAATNVTTITGTAAELVQALGNQEAIDTAGNVAVTLSSGTATAADLDTIANATTGIVTASLAANTAISDATVSAVSHVDANDVITFASTATTADATALAALNTLADTKSFTATGITEAFDTANLTTVIAAALAITSGTAETVAITGGTVTAADLNTIASATTGAVTASLAVDTAITDTVVTSLANVDANDVITFASTATTADATALAALNTLADTKSFAATGITEAFDTANLTTVIAAALAITSGTAETVAITGGTVTAADLDTIASATTGVVTASLAVDTAITDTVVTSLANVDANDVITFASTATTADATALAALNTLADTKSFAATGITEAFDTANLTTVIAAALAITSGTAETVTITGGTISAADANAIAAATTGIITATISGSAAELAGLIGTGNAYTVTVNDAATIAQLTNIDAATTVTVNYAAGISDLVANLVSGTTANSYITGAVPVTITSPATIAELTAIHGATSGTLIYDTIHDTAANLATLVSGVWTANPTYIKNGTNIIVDGDISTNELAALDVANGTGTVVSASNTTLSTPNTYLIETADTPIWTVSGGMVANVIDAAGDQTIHIANGGKLSLTGSDGHNVVVFDAFTASQLTASLSGSTVTFSDTSTTPIAIASISVTEFAPSQTIGFSDGSTADLLLVGNSIQLILTGTQTDLLSVPA
ncbi:MAG: hypothetical protein PHC99_00830, partial [Methylococcales bacterium]|nr:hypothetical protein [Methylococcales bacterium]